MEASTSWCAPLSCHADVLLDAIAWAVSGAPVPTTDGWRLAA